MSLTFQGPLAHAFEHKYLHVPYGPCGCGLATEVPSYIFQPSYPLAIVFSLILLSSFPELITVVGKSCSISVFPTLVNLIRMLWGRDG